MDRRKRKRPVVEKPIDQPVDNGGQSPMATRHFYPPPDEMIFKIPKDLLMKFEEEPRIVVRWPWIIGIPIPEWLLQNPELLGRAAEEFEPMLLPRKMYR
jgi:hypothetical protein